MVYLGIAHMWLSAGELEKADTALIRAETDLEGANWFKSAHPQITFGRGLIAMMQDEHERAKLQFRSAFNMVERLGDAALIGHISDCHHITLSLVLRENGKLAEVESRLQMAENPNRHCEHLENLLE